MTLKELANRISAHLARFEADPEINAPLMHRTRSYYGARAYPAGRYVRVVYINYQMPSHLTKAQAEAYLAWLDAGNVGTHWRVKP